MLTNRIITGAIAIMGVAVLAAYFVMTMQKPDSAAHAQSAPIAGDWPQIEITVRGEASGKIVLDLFDDVAPQHVERVLTLARDGTYDNVVFHRVIDGFMAQSGDVENGKLGGNLAAAGSGGSSFPDLPAEFSDRGFVRGTLGMARSSSPNSANSQFFIMFAPAPHLNGQYTVVGQVVTGLDVLDAIKRGTGGNGAIVGDPDVMSTVRVVE